LKTEDLVVISIIRAGDSMLDSFLSVCPSVKVGKILIQRDEETALPKLMYFKVPDMTGKQVILLDPMLATGGSAKEAIRVLLKNGADIEKLSFFSVISAPEGIKSVMTDYPRLKLVTGHRDQGLNERAYIIPGLGDYGDRFFGTV
jgi:uracil phosphoribosyltransferase